MKILITTEPDDIHAVLVKLVLENKGHHCVLWFSADMPTKQTNSMYFSNENYYWLSEDSMDKSLKIENDSFDVVWWRRPRRPFISETLHKNDLDFIKKENSIFHDSIPLVIANDAWWVNPYESIRFANSKIYQLKLASNFGLKIPPTLVSNSPQKIKEFIFKYKKESVIYKPFSSHHWHENDILKLSYTKSIELNLLPSDNILQMSPGIFQRQLEKKYELRVTCFGEHVVAIKIASQEHPKGLVDWRVIPSEELKIEPYQLSSTLKKSIFTFMKKLGIVFGCFDFIVTPDDQVYFLEVNQQGQFLWIEDHLPETKMLDIFVNFLIEKTLNFKWDNNSNSVRLKDFEFLACKLMEENMQHHVYLNAIKNQRVPA